RFVPVRGAGLDDVGGLREGQLLELRNALQKGDFHGQLVEFAHLLEIDDGAVEAVVEPFLVAPAVLDREDNVFGGEWLAVVPGDAVSELQSPDGEVLVRVRLGGEAWRHQPVRTLKEERVEQLEDPDEVREVERCSHVQGLRAAGGEQSDPEGPPHYWRSTR